MDKYPVFEDDDSLIYEFVSEGPKGRIQKMVVYETTDLPDVYNLGFGDKISFARDFDDFAVTNNNDTKKVLATVIDTFYLFIARHPNAIVLLQGNNRARNRCLPGQKKNYKFVTMKKKKLNDLKIASIVKPELNQYAHKRIFKEKIERANKLLKESGLPKEWLKK